MAAPPFLEAPEASRGSQLRALLHLGWSLSRRGVLSTVSLGIGAVTVLGGFSAAILAVTRFTRAPIEQIPALTASALAWGAGVLLAFAASTHAFRRDREEGIVALLAARAAPASSYVWARVGGLTLLLVALVGGGTLATGLVTALAATRLGTAWTALQGTLAAVVYAVTFALILGPLAMAALGARGRAGGYAWLLGVLVFPELLSPLTGPLAPSGFEELVSIPGALSGLRAALEPPHVDALGAFRAAGVLALVGAACILVVRRAARHVPAEAP